MLQSSSKSKTWWARWSVGRKMACIPLFFILALTALTAYTIKMVGERRAVSLISDIHARQRTLNQMHTKQVLLASRKLAAADQMLYTRKVIDQAIESLLNGGSVIRIYGQAESVEMSPAPSQRVRELLLKQREQVQSMYEKTDALLRLDPEDPAYRAEIEDVLKLEYELHLTMSETSRAFIEHSESGATTFIACEIAIGLVVGCLGILLSVLISRGIVGSLGRVVELAQNVATGNLTVQKLDTKTDDEVGRLTGVCNSMLDGLRELAGQIASVTENINSAAAEVLAATRQQASGAKEQAATVQQINSTMQEISRSGSQVVEKAKEVFTAAEAATASSNFGIEAVMNTNKIMDAIREQIEEVAENIVALSEKTQAVGEIVSTVNEIAEQSNLLALNATIESAAAEGNGSRFAVVANEMKNLADQAKQCTVQVRNILGDIQKGINSSVMLTEEAVKRADSGKQQADVTEQAIRQMTETTEQSIQVFQQISGATNQQQIGFEQVTRGMQDIHQTVEQTAAGTIQLEEAVASLTALGQQLRAAVGGYRL